MDVIAETSVLVTNHSQTFHWTGYGLKLHIPQEALPTGSEECRLLIKVGLSGQFALRQNTSLVSAVYWLDSEPRCTYSQPLTVEIQHCVKPIHSSRLSFIHAKCSQTHLPYVFEPVEGGEFSSESSYGCVQLDHFSLLGVGCNDLTSGVRLYRACLFYLNNGANLRDIHFVITWDEEPHTTVRWCALCCWSLSLLTKSSSRLSNRSTLPRVLELDQICRLNLSQNRFHWNCLLRMRFSVVVGECFHCFTQG